MPPTPKKKSSGDEAKTATVYATETFVAFQHPDSADVPTSVEPGMFKVLVGGEPADLSGWTATFLPDTRTTVLVPPEGRTIFEFGPESYGS